MTLPLCASDLDLNVRGAIGLRIPLVVIHEGTGEIEGSHFTWGRSKLMIMRDIEYHIYI